MGVRLCLEKDFLGDIQRFLIDQDSRIHAMMTESREGERGGRREKGREQASERESLLGPPHP